MAADEMGITADDAEAASGHGSGSRAAASMRVSLEQIADAGIRAQVEGFCDHLEKALRETGIDGDIPSMVVFLEPDEAYYEWILDGFRFGFCFLPDPDESGWFLVAGDEDVIEQARGTFGGDVPGFIDAVMRYISGDHSAFRLADRVDVSRKAFFRYSGPNIAMSDILARRLS